MVLKKKEIIAASLVVLIGVAGYLNWSYQDTIRVQDGETVCFFLYGSGGNINGQRGTKRQRASGGNGSNGR